ncbi:uncharacterized J domain-containing protein C1071.09c [Phoenix dactylifera]|uniref:Uncharacterized J domain-containing protein C1071.09c n=1 Tax=Phoenix dactylifera TaxID=42345 RepID=A0A8B7MUW4_PHODC|nr:uncharacterized J domain-containing protein C1071.09c [Phoenix dactylifera]
MERQMEEQLENKSQLVREICSISSIFASCSHRRRSSRKPVFIDWYLVLRIDEDVGIDVIRRRYRQLALQLHPDKNKHPRADVAFKLVSEAHACLSDKTKRKSFNSERWKNFCKECYKKSQFMPSGNHCNFHKHRAFYPAEQHAKSDRMMHTLREVQNRFREECGVIENCLRANKAHRREFPIFNPSEQVLYSPGYPHYRTQVFEEPTARRYDHTNNARKYWERGGRCESPVYEIRTENQSMRTKNFGFSF